MAAVTVSSGYHGGRTRNGRLTPEARRAASVSWPFVEAITPAPSTADRADTMAASQPLPPTTLLDVWPTTTAERRMAANCRQPLSRSSARSTSVLFSLQRAHGELAV